jgi:saccharopine dehydrogenase-like NADP-dependent oxidoreductase
MVSAQTIRHKVLLIGSGMMTPPLVDYLIQFKDTHITVASNILDDAKMVAARHPGFMSAQYLDIMDQQMVEDCVRGQSLVISFIPPWMHMKVLKPCLKVGVNVATSSYISPDMLSLDAEVKAKDLVFLNECGLDPGIDIMGTMKVVHDSQDHGLKVVSYESYCGGLPTAEQADNPLGYKFSWNPGAAIKASRNTATYMENGKRVVTNEPLKAVVDCDDVSVAMKLESYPNRDSTVFMDRFSMSDCHTFIRGTYRFKGFSSIISAFHDVGLTSDDLVGDGVSVIKDLCFWRFTKVAPKRLDRQAEQFVATLTDGMEQNDRLLVEGFLGRVDTTYLGGDMNRVKDAFKSIVKTMKFLGFFGSSTKLTTTDGKGNKRSCLDCFGDVMASKLKLESHDRDLIVMQHKFTLEDNKTKK